MAEKKEFLASRRGVNYLDLFAGAGGFSEGFMQAYTDDKFYDFRLASEIEHTKNPNVGQFDVLIEQNIITVDLLLCHPSGHGDTYSFKIKKKGMPLLFPESVIYNL